jgi:hypothetical protein
MTQNQASSKTQQEGSRNIEARYVPKLDIDQIIALVRTSRHQIPTQ